MAAHLETPERRSNPPSQRAVLSLALTLGLGTAGAAAPPISSLRWTQLNPSVSPPAVRGGSLAYDPRAEGLLLFGGQGESGNLDETSSWDGKEWIRLTPTTSPPASIFAPMAYDEASE